MSYKSLEALRDKERKLKAEIEKTLEKVCTDLQSSETTKLMVRYQKLLIERKSVNDLIHRLEKIK